MNGSGPTVPRRDRPPPTDPRPSGPMLAAAALCVLGGALSFLAVTLARNAPLTESAAGERALRIAQVTSQHLAPSCPNAQSNAFYDASHFLCRVVDLDGGLTVRDVTTAEAVPEPTTSRWAVRVTFRQDDAAALRALSARVRLEPYPRGQVAFLSGDRLLSAGVLAGPDGQGTASLAGTYTRAEAEDIAGQLRG